MISLSILKSSKQRLPSVGTQTDGGQCSQQAADAFPFDALEAELEQQIRDVMKLRTKVDKPYVGTSLSFSGKPNEVRRAEVPDVSTFEWLAAEQDDLKLVETASFKGESWLVKAEREQRSRRRRRIAAVMTLAILATAGALWMFAEVPAVAGVLRVAQSVFLL